MSKRGFWTKKRKLPGEQAVDDTVFTIWSLADLHPPSAAAMLLGALGLGYVGWWLLRDFNLLIALIAAVFGAFIGAWTGLLFYWLARLIRAFID